MIIASLSLWDEDLRVDDFTQEDAILEVFFFSRVAGSGSVNNLPTGRVRVIPESVVLGTGSGSGRNKAFGFRSRAFKTRPRPDPLSSLLVCSLEFTHIYLLLSSQKKNLSSSLSSFARASEFPFDISLTLIFSLISLRGRHSQ